MRPPIGPVRTHHAWRPTIGPAIDGGYPRGARTHTRKYSRPTDRAGGVLSFLPPHPEENYHLHPNENFRIENPHLHFTTTKRGLDKYEYTDNTINIHTCSR